MSRYEPLKKYLLNLKQKSINLTFSEIESILGFALPKSAYTYCAWWANGGHSQAYAWLGGGYKVKDLDIDSKTVNFEQTGSMSKSIEQVVNKKPSVQTQAPKQMTNLNSTEVRNIHGYEFHFVQKLIPELNSDGKIKKYYPQAGYANKNRIPLQRFGSGAFCRFSILAGDWPGVYLWVVDGEIIYIGETVRLRQRFNAGYGNISSRNCYLGGQITNCKMNKVVLELYEKGKVISLYFCKTTDYKQVELNLLNKINTTYNVKDN